MGPTSKYFVLLAILSGITAVAVRAEDEVSSPAASDITTTTSAPTTSTTSTITNTTGGDATGDGGTDSNQEAKSNPARGSKHAASGRRQQSREKETDGTEASDRFEANTVIKSRYRINNEPLEVDPD